MPEDEETTLIEQAKALLQQKQLLELETSKIHEKIELSEEQKKRILRQQLLISIFPSFV